jgi:predicted flap endonuclease-1-like 5' DNA nuclease
MSDALKESFQRCDELQQQVKDVRGDLDVAVAEREELRETAEDSESRDQLSLTAIRERDSKIFRLSRELTSWQNRVPPLVEKFRERDLEAQELEVELQKAHDRIAALESTIGNDNTRIEPVDPKSLTEGLNASNDPLDGATGEIETEIVDQDASYGEVSLDPQEPVETELRDIDEPVQSDAVVNDQELAGDDADDLKLIKGVGPAIERTLNDLGIYRFNQIAEMSEYDIDRVAQRLRGFRSRIYREDWVGQARSLQYQKYNDLS